MSHLILMHAGNRAVDTVGSGTHLTTLGTVAGIVVFIGMAISLLGLSLVLTEGVILEFLVLGFAALVSSAVIAFITSFFVSIGPWVVLGVLILVTFLALIALVFRLATRSLGV